MKLWSLAGRVYHEALFAGQMSAAGSNIHRVTERLNKDSRYLKRQGNMVQIFGSFYLLIVSMVSVLAILEYRLEDPSQWNALVTAGALSIQMLIQTGYLIMLTVLATAEILAPDLYRWFESLPLSRAQVGTLRLLALAREFLFPVGVIVISLPLVAGLAGQSLIAGVAGVALGVVHGGFTLALAVLTSWKMRTALKADGGDERKAKLTRVITMLVYGLGTIVVIFIMQVGTNVVSRLLGDPLWAQETTRTVFIAVTVLPLPTAPAGLLTLLAAGTARPESLPLWAPLLGTGLYTALTAGLLQRVRALIVRGPQSQVHETGTETHEVQPLTVRSPRQAFRRQLLQAATRDTQVLISLIFPLVLPLLSVVGPAIASEGAAPVGVLSLVVSAGGGGWIMIHALTRLQVGAGALEASLPVRERDRVFPRLALLAVLPAAGAALPALLLFSLGSSEQLSLIGTAIAMAVTVPGAAVVKMALFGRAYAGSDPVVLDEIRTGGRFWKWVLVVVSLIAPPIGSFVAVNALFAGMGQLPGFALWMAITGVAGLLLTVGLRRLFR